MKPFKEAEGYAEDLQAAYDYYKTYSRRTAVCFSVLTKRPSVSWFDTHSSVARDHMVGDRSRFGGIPATIFYKEFPKFWLLAGVVSTLRDPDTIQARLLILESQEDAESR